MLKRPPQRDRGVHQPLPLIVAAALVLGFVAGRLSAGPSSSAAAGAHPPPQQQQQPQEPQVHVHGITEPSDYELESAADGLLPIPGKDELSKLQQHLQQVVAASIGGDSPLNATPFYVTPVASQFRHIAWDLVPRSDKIAWHAYDVLYSHYLEAGSKRRERLKVLEIGLGCDPDYFWPYGIGASALLWSKYLPHAEVWIAEYNATCAEILKPSLDSVGAKVVLGDQADVPTLHRWIEQTGGNFDVIIDDGGHCNHQILTSFNVLFHKALKPGGVYFLEDVHVGRHEEYRGTGPVMFDVIRDWIESILDPIKWGTPQQMRDHLAANPWPDDGLHRLPVGAKTIECGPQMCAVTKCVEDDWACLLGGTPGTMHGQ